MTDHSPIPAYYVVPRTIAEDRISAFVDYLGMTPPICAVISRYADMDIARCFTADVLLSGSSSGARAIAKQIAETEQRAVVVVDGAPEPVGVWPDDSEEPIQC